MSIKIGISPSMQSLTRNIAEFEVDGSTVGECLARLAEQFPDIKDMLLIKDNKLFGQVGIYVNREKNITRELDKPVEDGEELYLLYMVAGG